MTIKEAIKVLKEYLALDEDIDSEYLEAQKVVIKALEQEPILDKIRDEIEQVRLIMDDEIKNHDRKDLINFVNGLNQSLMIIDRYTKDGE